MKLIFNSNIAYLSKKMDFQVLSENVMTPVRQSGVLIRYNDKYNFNWKNCGIVHYIKTV